MLLCGTVAALAAAVPAAAQPPAARGKPLAGPEVLDPATVEMPDLSFQPTPDAEKDYDKYFYFHRADTDFATAYADILECDAYARGVSFHVEGPPAYSYANYGIGGAVGGAIGTAIADAIFGSQQRRQQRRNIMRTCMGFKEYKAYGLPRDVWEKFNFEEGLSTVEEGRRRHLLQVQARVASGPMPHVGEMDQ
jgi:hypothetical protein